MKLIAEIGWNHMGDISLAKKMIKSAASSGADYCKFQTWSEKKLVPGSWDKDGRREIYKKAELSIDDHYNLYEFCKKNKTNFLTTVFDAEHVKFLSQLSNDIIKIGSPEVYNIDLIKMCLEKFKLVILSTGASKWSEILKLKKLNLKKLILLHCVSSYPCQPENVNILRMQKLKRIFPNVGYSGHYPGTYDAIIAICTGAHYVEKHFTIDKKLPGRDNKFALAPKEFKSLKIFRDNYIKMSEFKGLNLQECEYDVYKKARGRWSGKKLNYKL
jgi:N,N'-diacetyllegionaminate synthase